jgi:ABC-type multidrug transport system fused ATPase/permease subunit
MKSKKSTQSKSLDDNQGLSVFESFMKSVSLLDRKSKKNIFLVSLIQSMLSILDLVGVALMGLLAAISVKGIQSGQQTEKTKQFLNIFGLDSLSFQNQVAIIAGISTLFLVTRTILSIYFNRRILFFLSTRAGYLSSSIMRAIISDRHFLNKHNSSQSILYAVTEGVLAITVGIIGTGIALFTDTILLVVIMIGLFFIDPVLAISSFFFFGFVGISLYGLLYKKARSLGRENSKVSVLSNESILEAMLAIKEIKVRGRSEFYLNRINKQRLAISRLSAEMAFMPSISKYVLEISVVMGALIISLIQFITKDATEAISSLLIFMAAGTRVAPAILRTQQGAILIKANIGGAKPTFEMLDELEWKEVESFPVQELNLIHGDFSPTVEIKHLRYEFDETEAPIFTDLNLQIKKGEVVAIAGPSGAGKTTLVDLILGIRTPLGGEVRISGELPTACVMRWPGAIGYVPQNVYIINASIKSNIALGFDETSATDDHYWNCLKIAHLDEFVNELPDGLETLVGESGARLSGGQRQRLGIARALFTNPSLLIFDEATSALDGKTESSISESILEMRGVNTILIIAHRLSTIKNADKVIYLSHGRLVAEGTFNEIRKLVPDFDSQIKVSEIRDREQLN